jgi:2-succinyl-6-hydroxy-2,4-cyclohexadiene-1-carboxylate synthase
VSGRLLHVERRGRGPALVQLHGFTGSSASLAGVARAFAQDYETLSVDLPGHGRSVGERGAVGRDFDDCLDDLVATLGSAGHDRAHWLGYSMGARLALGCAVRYPERVNSLVLVGARAGIEDPDERDARRRADDELAARIETHGVEAFVDEWLAQPLFASQRRLGPEFLAAERRARLGNDARELAASLRGLGPGTQPLLFESLPALQVPVLLVAGARDGRFIDLARDLSRRLPQAEVCVIEDAGHAVHLEQPEAFLRAARDFMRRAERRAIPLSSSPVQEIAP